MDQEISLKACYRPKILQNTSFELSLFAPVVLKKTRNSAGYYSLFSKPQAQKSSRPKTSILKEFGYSANFANPKIKRSD